MISTCISNGRPNWCPLVHLGWMPEHARADVSRAGSQAAFRCSERGDLLR